MANGWYPSSKKRVNYLSCIEGNVVVKTFIVVHKIPRNMLIYYKISFSCINNTFIFTFFLFLFFTFFLTLSLFLTFFHLFKTRKRIHIHIYGGLDSILIFKILFLSLLKISKTFVFFLRKLGKYSKKYRQGSVISTDPWKRILKTDPSQYLVKFTWRS